MCSYYARWDTPITKRLVKNIDHSTSRAKLSCNYFAREEGIPRSKNVQRKLLINHTQSQYSIKHWRRKDILDTIRHSSYPPPMPCKPLQYPDPGQMLQRLINMLPTYVCILHPHPLFNSPLPL
jgi:hypothetical protein